MSGNEQISFLIKIDTREACDLQTDLTGALWFHKLQLQCSPPLAATPSEQANYLSEFFEKLQSVPYKNLAAYEGVLGEAQRELAIVAQRLRTHDTSRTFVHRGMVSVTVHPVIAD